jgi:hypothetical protein
VNLSGHIEASDTPSQEKRGLISSNPNHSHYGRTYLILSLDGIGIQIKELAGFEKVCIRSIEFLFALKAQDGFWTSQWRMHSLAIPEEKSCVSNIFQEINKDNLPEDATSGYHSLQEKITLGSIPKGYAQYFYPFDSIDIQARFRTTLDYYNKDGNLCLSKQVPTGMSVLPSFTGWELWSYDTDSSAYIYPLDYDFGSAGDEKRQTLGSTNALFLALKRPIFIKFLTPALLTMLYAIALATMLFKPSDLVVEISIGVLIGVWGTRQILLPSDVQSWTVVDMSLMIIYFLIMLVFAAQVLSQVRQVQRIVKDTPLSREALRHV